MPNETPTCSNLAADLEPISWGQLTPRDRQAIADKLVALAEQRVLADRTRKRLEELIGVEHAEVLGAGRLYTEWCRPKLRALSTLVAIVDYAIEDARRASGQSE